MNLCDPSTIRNLMAEQGIRFRKEYGQNFLIDPTVPKRIADLCANDPDSVILEVGPGIGTLTQELSARYASVTAVEIDTGLIPVLARTLQNCPNVKVINDDIMKVSLGALVSEMTGGRKPRREINVSVCANLPYYITTPILMRLLESGVCFTTVTVMIQKEVADRLCAHPGTSDYGAITAVLGYYGTVKKLFTVPATAFLPAPKVDSSVVRIDLYEQPLYTPKDEKLFFSCIRGAFEQRRKTLLNALTAKIPSLTKEMVRRGLAEIGLPEDIRGERLSTGDFVRLSDFLSMQIKG